MYYSESNRPGRITQPETSVYEDEYEEHIDTKTGKPYLKKVGKVNVYDKIQEAADGVTLKEIIKRYGIDPSESAEKLDTVTGEIIDYTNCPSSLMEALEITNGARNIFEKSAKEIKQAFNNNFTEFLASAQNGTLEKKLSEFRKQKAEVDVPVSSVVEEPQEAVPQENKPTGVSYE